MEEAPKTFLEIFSIVAPITALIVGSLLGYVVGILRDKKKALFQEKLSTYTSLLMKISSSFIDEISSGVDIRSIMSRDFGKARLLAEKKLSDELRNYYDLRISWHKYLGKESAEEKKYGDLVAESAMKIEELMRNELGKKRILSDQDIEEHFNNKSHTKK